VREAHKLGSQPLGIRENRKNVSLRKEDATQLIRRRTVMSETKTLREWVEEIGSSGLMNIIATKFSGETWESEFDMQGASEMLDDILSDLNLCPFAEIIKKQSS
jgi:hypothetical protein